MHSQNISWQPLVQVKIVEVFCMIGIYLVQNIVYELLFYIIREDEQKMDQRSIQSPKKQLEIIDFDTDDHKLMTIKCNHKT